MGIAAMVGKPKVKKFEYFEIQISTDPDFVKKFGKKLRAVGGDYKAARGRSTCRTVYVPADHADLAKGIITEFGSGKATTIVLRGSNCLHTVFYATAGTFDMKLAEATQHASPAKIATLESAIDSAKRDTEFSKKNLAKNSVLYHALKQVKDRQLSDENVAIRDELIGEVKQKMDHAVEWIQKHSARHERLVNELNEIQELYKQ